MWEWVADADVDVSVDAQVMGLWAQVEAAVYAGS